MNVHTISDTGFQPWEKIVSDEEVDQAAGKALRDRKELSKQLEAVKIQANSICGQMQRGIQVLEGKASAKMENGLHIKMKGSGMYEPCNWPTVEKIAELSQKWQEIERRLAEANDSLKEMGYD